MSEFEAIGRIAAALPGPPEGEEWIGDDAAVVVTAGTRLLLCADAVVAGVHADLSLTGLDDLGWRALSTTVSDIAAMGGDPGHAVVCVVAPPSTDLDLLYRGVGAAAAALGCPVVGGDLSSGPFLVVTVAVTGTVEGDPVLRRGARPGDRLWVTGPLGAAAAGLRQLRAGGPVDPALRQAHARPQARLAEGRAARRAGATAMLDVSDGLSADVAHLADASGVGVELSAPPVAVGATADEALSGGDDYELVFVAPAGAEVARCFEGLRPPIPLGTVVAEPAVRTVAGRPLGAAGWQHRW